MVSYLSRFPVVILINVIEQELLRAEQLNRLRSPSAVELLSLQNKLHYSKDICEDELGVFLCQSELVVLSAEGHETWLEVIIKMAIRKLPFLQVGISKSLK